MGSSPAKHSPPGCRAFDAANLPGLPRCSRICSVTCPCHYGDKPLRFLGKYELLEQLTVGTVETFAAYPIGGGERILVHVFALPALVKVSPTNQDLLDCMQKVAPPALGAVLDAGRYDDGSQAFIVTKFPRDSHALPKWVEAYKMMSKKHDTTAEVAERKLWEGEKTAPATPEPGGDFTRAFQGSGSEDSPKSASVTEAFGAGPAAPDDPEKMSLDRSRATPPGSLTEQFMAGLGDGAYLGSHRSQLRPEYGALYTEVAPAAPAKIASPDPWTPAEPDAPSDPSRDGSRAGEFTRYFRSPLAPTGSAMPAAAPEPLRQSSSRPRVGEFTEIFGPSNPPAGSSAPPEPLLEAGSPDESRRGGFTDIFGRVNPQPRIEPVEPAASNPTHNAAVHVVPGAPYLISQNTSLPALPQPKPMPPETPILHSGISMGGSALGQESADAATRLFRSPQPEIEPAPSPASPGESEYTRIISSKPKPADVSASPSDQKAQPGGAPLKLQIALTPPPPLTLQSPHLQVAAPAPTPLPVPKVPQIPSVSIPSATTKTGKKKRGWVPYAPLIVILNLLLLAAVSLILYFIVKR